MNWTKEDAIAYMEQSNSIIDWNNRREYVKALTPCNQEREVLAHIDSSGLITKVLGIDPEMIPAIQETQRLQVKMWERNGIQLGEEYLKTLLI